MDLTLHPLTSADVPAWAELLTAIEAVDRTGDHYDEGDLQEELANPEVEVGKDFVGARAGGELLGYFSVLPRGETGSTFKVQVEGAVRPDARGRGIGTALVTAMLDRAVEAARERRPDLPVRVIVTGLSANTAQAELFETFGLRPERWEFAMRVRLDQVPSADGDGPSVAGYDLRPYEASMDQPVLAAHNSAFLDHPDFTPWSAALWHQFVTGSKAFRPDLSFVAVPAGTDTIAAYLQTDEYEGYQAATGRREAYVSKLGTVRGHRGRGLASGLLSHALRAYQEAGYDESSLHVDSQNPTGALAVYQRAGFEVETRLTSYAALLGA
ncbi:GNAT family N-acetyltransferase [Angustibacter luteus]|uniref:GNAT family N-acetyltransferase n=1 Tax=Angustibacter luteus TaxID=658456 RepID=A0ABW1JKY1_9ACTN